LLMKSGVGVEKGRAWLAFVRFGEVLLVCSLLFSRW
jgi:hypothetical protein